MKKERKSFWDAAAEVFPESLDLLEQTKKKLEAGLVRDAPRTWTACQNWGDAWLYIFMRVDLDASQPLRWNGDKVVCVVLQGQEFDDKLLAKLRKCEQRLGINRDLQELRLIDTGFSEKGIQWLRDHFATASICLYTEEDAQRDPNLCYADPARSPYNKAG